MIDAAPARFNKESPFRNPDSTLSRSLSAPLYFLSGAIGGGLLFSIMIWGIWGRATNWFELTAFCGSLLLLMTAFGSLINPRRAARYALFGSLLQWIWLGPIANWIVRELFVAELPWYPLIPVYFIFSVTILLSVINALHVMNSEHVGSAIQHKVRWVNICAGLFLGVLALVPIHERMFPQVIEVVVAQWMPGAQPLTVIEPASPRERPLISVAEIAELSALGLTGELSVRWGQMYGTGERKARMLIVTQPIIDTVVELAQPNATSVIYVQRNNGWTMLPSNSSLAQQVVRFEPRKMDATMILVYQADGGGTGNSIHWRLPCIGSSC